VIRSRYRQTILSNPWLVAAVVSSLALQALVLYTPLRDPFGVNAIDGTGWLWLALALSAFVMINVVFEKISSRPRK
jgi:Ca2+-transporting ATPase